MITTETTALTDSLGRPIRDLRISVIDRCNFRCVYCMPRETFGANHQFLPSKKILSYDEIETIARQFVALGVKKIRPDRWRAIGAPEATRTGESSREASRP